MVETGIGSRSDDWSGVGISDVLGEHLRTLGYPSPTALQRALIPAVLNETDVLIEAPAGTGRTMAVGITIAELVSDCEPGDSPVALVIASDDARCAQLAAAVQRCGSALKRSGDAGLRCAIVSELGPAEIQGELLTKPLDVVVGTPQRLNQLASAEQLTLSTLEMVIVDEADDLALGDHATAFTALLDSIPADRQRVVMAGALLTPLLNLMEKRLSEPQRPALPLTDPVRSALPQRAFSAPKPTPEIVGRLARSLGAALTIAVVGVDEVERYQRFVDQSNLALGVQTRADTLRSNATVIYTTLPSWTDKYAQILDDASTAGCAEIVLLATAGQRHLLRALGRTGGVQLNASPLPSESGVTALQLAHTNNLVLEQLARISAQPTPRFLSSVHRLAAEYDIADIAAAAMELAHLTLQREISPGADIPLLLRDPAAHRPAANDRRQDPVAADSAANRRQGADRRGKEAEAGMTRLFVAAGYNYGVRPGDIVGAFAGESGLSGKEIGNIDIRESFTLVEVPEKLAEDVISAMQNGTIKGRQIEVRRERY